MKNLIIKLILSTHVYRHYIIGRHQELDQEKQMFFSGLCIFVLRTSKFALVNYLFVRFVLFNKTKKKLFIQKVQKNIIKKPKKKVRLKS